MNLFLIVILLAIVLEFVIDVVSNVLNLNSLKSEAPVGLEDVYSPSEYQRSQEYTKATTHFGLAVSFFNLLFFLGFWFIGGFNVLDLWVRSFNTHVVITGVIYLYILIVSYSVVKLPFALYSTFVIEQRFGFNKMTPLTFALDTVKGLLLTLILGIPLLAILLAFFEYTGSLAWVYAWGAVTIFTLGIQFIVPTWIMPIFNKFVPLEEGELRTAIQNYAHSVNFKLENILVMDGSKRSSKANAFFTGFGKNKRIVLFDTLVANHTVTELVSVLAHEIGHYKMRHILKTMVLSIIQVGMTLILLSLVLENRSLHDAFFMDSVSIYAGLLFFGLLYSPLDMILSIIMHAISRKHEYEGDKYAVRTISDPGKMIDALKKLSAENLSNLEPHPFYVVLNHTHPPLKQRVQAINDIVQ